MLSATVIGSGQVAVARHASSMIHSPSAGISPVSSATGMKTLGGTKPRCGWFQRSSASKPTSFWVLALISGWKTRWNCLAAMALRRSAFEPDAILLLGLELGREIAGAAAAGVLRLVEREVGLEDEVVDRGAVDRAERAADRDADADLGLVDHVGLADRAMIRSASCSTVLRLCASLMTIANSSPPMRPTVPLAATSSTSRLATARSTASPLGWPKVSLTGLKPSRSRNMIAHGTLPRGRAAQRFAEQLADAAAVGQAGQHVDVGEVGQALLRLANLGDVGADSAEAFEAAGGVDDRVAGHRDPARAARRRQLHLQRVERLLFEQHAGQARHGRREVREASGRCSWLAGLPSIRLMRRLM